MMGVNVTRGLRYFGVTLLFSFNEMFEDLVLLPSGLNS